MLSKKLLKEMQDYLDHRAIDVFDFYASRNDDLSDEDKQRILNGDIGDVIDELWDYNIDYIMDLESAAIKDIQDWFEPEILEELEIEDIQEIDQDDLYQELRYNLSPYVNMNISAICESIPVRFELHSNYDCMNSHWLESSGGYSYRESYFGDVVDFLRLNPSILKKHLVEHDIKVVGSFPNYSWRNGKEIVGYDQFVWELTNSIGSANLFTVLGVVDVDDILKNQGKKPIKVDISGCSYGFFDSFYGSGSSFGHCINNTNPIKIGQQKKNDDYLSFDMVSDFGSYNVKDVYGSRDMFSDVNLIY